MRREVFDEAGMYDEWHYARPQIEDIELGARIARARQAHSAAPDIQVTHLKKWTLAGVRAHRPPRSRHSVGPAPRAPRGDAEPRTLNLRWTEKLNTILVWLAVLALPVALFFWDYRPLYVTLACLLAATAMNLPLLSFFARTRGLLFAISAVPVHLLYYLLNGVSFGLGLSCISFLGRRARIPPSRPTLK